MIGKDRLDRVLLARNLAKSREQAQALIMAGAVLLNGQKAVKPGQLVGTESTIDLLSRPRYVSRGGLKLEAALRHFGISVAGAVCLDVGSSTGGFTDCLLQAGAARVYAVDAGTAQLDWKLRSDERVVVLENQNARYLRLDDIGEAVDFISCDVSFISVLLVLPAIMPILKPHGTLVILVKPQFEAGREQVGSGGIVRDPAIHQAVCDRVRAAVESYGFRTDLIDSPILGAEGNREFLLFARRNVAEVHI